MHIQYVIVHLFGKIGSNLVFTKLITVSIICIRIVYWYLFVNVFLCDFYIIDF